MHNHFSRLTVEERTDSGDIFELEATGGGKSLDVRFEVQGRVKGYSEAADFRYGESVMSLIVIHKSGYIGGLSTALQNAVDKPLMLVGLAHLRFWRPLLMHPMILFALAAAAWHWLLQEQSELEKKDPQELVASFSERVRNMSPDDIRIPPEPPGRCSNNLQEKILKMYERKVKEGTDMNQLIQKKKEFRNPSIYEKLIQFCSIDELGTNYPKDMFDPHGWAEDSYYEALAKAQKIEMDKLEKAKKNEQSAPTGTTSTTTTATADAQKRKSKWDSAIPMTTITQPTILTTTTTLPSVVTVTTSASGSKTTVISAVGTIVKKAKQ
ncbi:unnamed protein product [Ranitomeya imitator]|uniref:SAP30-binding protein n=1 Tax=Ranitomeya imitator TaxID=111125 RepID=A0ABN9M0D8_9NEOB|nr:unnamed protein product [Ranitomeya imitator]